ncbi:MAG: thiamine biosynthesis protein [Desulfocapsa sp.]|nr:thiamine biosynthesis protein [Desulfocapsa sp.]
MKKRIALALFSGGLDSILAAKLVASLGVHVVAIKFVTPFFDYQLLGEEEKYKQEIMEKYGLEVKLHDLSENYLELLHNPSHGFGKNFNPCIDCKILMCTRAKEMMVEYDASFLISGEVLGQRPMSQRRDTLRVIERDSDNDGLLLRPLSAKLMTPTKAETEGWIDRDKLLNFSGRGRSRQIELAKQFGVKDFPAPAGGCILADPILSKRIEKIYRGDFVIQAKEIKVNDVRLLLVGRQFELPEGAWLILGRNEKENIKIEGLAEEDDLLLHMPNRPGPIALLRNARQYVSPGDSKNTILQHAAGLVIRYGKKVKGVDPGTEVQMRGLGERWKIIGQPLEAATPQ